MLEGSKPFDCQSETSDMRGGFGTLRSKGSLHRGLTVNKANKAEVQNQARGKATCLKKSRGLLTAPAK